MRLEDKVAIVTGGGTGIGRASAIRFAAEGAKVAVAGRRLDPLVDVVGEIEQAGGQALAVQADVGESDDCRRLIDEVVAHFGTLHVLFNNAAQTHLQKTVDEMTVEEWDQCFNASLRSVFLLSKYAAPIMRDAGGGSIINCGSVGAIMPWRGGGAYCSAKSAVNALSKVLAIEYGSWGIRVNTLSPGAIRTPNLEASIERNEHEEKLLNKSVLHRIGEPEEIAAAAVFLAGDEASFVSTTNLIVDGGYLTM